MKKNKLTLLILASSFLFSCSQQDDQILLAQLPTNVQSLTAKTPEKSKVVESKATTKTKDSTTNSYKSFSAFIYPGQSLWVSPTQDITSFLKKFGEDIEHFELIQIYDDIYDNGDGRPRFHLTIFGPNQAKLYEISEKFRKYLIKLDREP